MSDVARSTAKVRDDWWTRAWEWIDCWNRAWECLALAPNVLVGLVTSHEVSNGIQYSYASHPCSHVFLETVDVREKKIKKEGIRKTLFVFLYCCEEENCGLILRVKVGVKCDTLVGVFLCGSRRCYGSLCPKKCGIVPGLLDLWASGDAFPSIWGVVRWWCY